MKNIRFSVGVKLLSAFAFFSIIIVVSGLYLFSTLQQYKNGIEKYQIKYSPSIILLNKISNNVSKSNELILIWVYVEKTRNTKSKNSLDLIIGYKLPELLKKIKKYEKLWGQNEKKQFLEINKNIIKLMDIESSIMMQLENDIDYTNETNLNEIKNKFGTGEELTALSSQTIEQLLLLISNLESEFSLKQKELIELYEKTRVTLFIRAAILLIISIFIAFLTANKIVKPIKRIRSFVFSMSKGILKTEKIFVQNDEIGDISKAINQLSQNLNKTANFSREIGKGNFNVDYTPLGSEDVLGNSLLTTKENLLKTENFRKKNDEQESQRNWATNGIAKFSELLRDNNDLEELSYIIIRDLVKYLEINQGGFFLINEEDKTDIYLELKAAYAYEYKTEEEKHIKPGETLVGQCFIEKETIYITKVPSNYLRITSGLGDEKPGSLLIVPLKIEDTILGVLELASFFEFDEYKIKFVEKISESITGTITNIETAKNTEKLLNESRQLTHQFSAQEEETRQIMEEMQATQEELENNSKIEKENEAKAKEQYMAEVDELKAGLEYQIEMIKEQENEINNLKKR